MVKTRVLVQVDKAPPQKKESSNSVRVGETLDYVLASSNLDPNIDEEKETTMEKLSSFPSAVSEPRWALHMCDKNVQSRRLQVLRVCLHCH